MKPPLLPNPFDKVDSATAAVHQALAARQNASLVAASSQNKSLSGIAQNTASAAFGYNQYAQSAAPAIAIEIYEAAHECCEAMLRCNGTLGEEHDLLHKEFEQKFARYVAAKLTYQ